MKQVEGEWHVVGPDPQFEPAAQLLADGLRAPVDEGGAGIQEVIVTDVDHLVNIKHRAPISSMMFVTHGNLAGQIAPHTHLAWNEKDAAWEDKVAGGLWELEDVAEKAMQAGLSPFGLLVLYGCKLGDPGQASRRYRIANDNRITLAVWRTLMNWEMTELEAPPGKNGERNQKKTKKQLAKEKKERLVGTGLVRPDEFGSSLQHPGALKPPVITGRLDEVDGSPEWDLLIDCEKTVVHMAREAGLDVALAGRKPNPRAKTGANK